MTRSIVLMLGLVACGRSETYDVVIRHGTVYDGSGESPFADDVAIRGDAIAAIGDLARDRFTLEIVGEGESMGPLVFDPAKLQDHATTPGRVVRGAGRRTKRRRLV